MSTISSMVAGTGGTAKGELLPPFVCSKAKELFMNSWRLMVWTHGGTVDQKASATHSQHLDGSMRQHLKKIFWMVLSFLKKKNVASFGSMKRKWRELFEKVLSRVPNVSAVKKYLFLQLLKKLLQEMEPTSSTSLITGFHTNFFEDLWYLVYLVCKRRQILQVQKNQNCQLYYIRQIKLTSNYKIIQTVISELCQSAINLSISTSTSL